MARVWGGCIWRGGRCNIARGIVHTKIDVVVAVVVVAVVVVVVVVVVAAVVVEVEAGTAAVVGNAWNTRGR